MLTAGYSPPELHERLRVHADISICTCVLKGISVFFSRIKKNEPKAGSKNKSKSLIFCDHLQNHCSDHKKTSKRAKARHQEASHVASCACEPSLSSLYSTVHKMEPEQVHRRRESKMILDSCHNLEIISMFQCGSLKL